MNDISSSEQHPTYNDAIVTIGGKEAEVIPYAPPKFDVSDPAGVKYFQDYGYVVFKDVATPDEIQQGKELFWKYLNNSFPAIERDNTWNNNNWPLWSGTGIVMADGIGNSEFTWFCRGLPKVKQIYSSIWGGEDDLVVSMDAAGVARPPEYDPEFVTLSGWYHFDQNGYQKKGFHCAQGLLNFYPSGPKDGGLSVLPKSHATFDKVFEEKSYLGDRDFVRITKPEIVPQVWDEPDCRPIKICLDPGDFAVWDSRTGHCNHPATPQATPPPILDFKRLVCYICMTPIKNSKTPEKVAKKRLAAFRDGMTTSHWPHEYQPRGRKCDKQPEFFLNQHQKELLVGKAVAVALGEGPLSSKSVPTL